MSTPTPITIPTRDTALAVVTEELTTELKITDLELREQDELDLLPGADSVRLMRVVAALERRYGVEFDDTAIRTAVTVGDMADLLRDGLRDHAAGQ